MKKYILVLFLACIAIQCVPTSAAFADSPPRRDRPRHVVIFSLPRVTWAKLSSHDTPHIDRIISRGSVAALSVRTLGDITTPEKAYATISAGSRATASTSSIASFLSPLETINGINALERYKDERGSFTTKNPAAMGVGFESSLRSNAKGLYGSKIGFLADALYGHDKSIAAFGNADPCMTDSPECFKRAVAYSASDSDGIMRRGDVSRDLLTPSLTDSEQLFLNENVVQTKARAALKKHDVVVVECSDLERVEQARHRTIDALSEKNFSDALTRCDSMIGAIMEDVSLTKDQVYVLSPTSPLSREQTTVFIAAGKKIPQGYASSSTTRRTGIVTLVDIAPTILNNYGIALPGSMGDTLLDWRKDSASRTSRENFLQRLNDQAVIRDKSVVPVTLLLVGFVVAGALLAVAARRRYPSLLTPARMCCLIAACVPTLGFLVRPFTESLGTPYNITFALFCAALCVASILYYIAQHYGYIKVILGVVSINLFVQFIDVLFGGNLQFNTVFGYSPVIAGRFAGYGNQAFGIVAASAIVVVAMVKEVTLARTSIRQSRVNVALLAFLIVVLIIDGAPFFGSDVGGVLALTPTIFIIGMMLYGKRIGIRAFIVASFVTAIAVTTFAFIDLARPENKRTHLGRFVQSLFDGRGGIVIERKLIANLAIFASSASAVFVLGTIIYMVYLFSRPEKHLILMSSTYPSFRYLAYPSLVVAALGMLLNDSGVAIPGIMLAITLPAVTLLALDVHRDATESVT